MTSTPAQRSPLTLGTSVSYAVGNVGMQMLVAGMSFFLMIFYTDVALVPPAVAGAALLIGKVWDTVNDPLFGWLTDRTRSRFGRRRVYLWFGSAPLAVLAAAVWMMTGTCIKTGWAFTCWSTSMPVMRGIIKSRRTA